MVQFANRSSNGPNHLLHPNLVKVYGFKIEYELVYLIMERCDCSLSASSAGGCARSARGPVYYCLAALCLPCSLVSFALYL